MGSRYFSCRIFKKRPKKGVAAPEKPKSFKTAEAAKKWAEAQSMKGFSVVEYAPGKFKIRRRI
jgi:hypothetical protein